MSEHDITCPCCDDDGKKRFRTKGATISFSTQTPDTFDEEGYEALDYVEVGTINAGGPKAPNMIEIQGESETWFAIVSVPPGLAEQMRKDGINISSPDGLSLPVGQVGTIGPNIRPGDNVCPVIEDPDA